MARDDVERLRRGCRALVRIGAMATVPLCFGMAGARQELVGVVLGPRWTAIVDIIPGIAAGTAAAMIGHLFAVMNEAVGRVREKFRIQMILSAATVAAFLLLGNQGLVACSAVFALSSLSFLLAQAALSADVLALRWRDVASWLVPSFVCGTLLYTYATVVSAQAAGRSGYLVLGVEITGCAILALGFYALVSRDTLLAALSYVRPTGRAAI